MSKTSTLALVAVLASAVAASSQSAAARPAHRHHAARPDPRLYDLAPGYDQVPGGLYDYAPGPVSPYSNFPAQTGGGSLGYNIDNLRDN